MLTSSHYRYAFFISIIFHAIVLVFLIASFEWTAKQFVIENTGKDAAVINAIMVNDAKIQLPHPTHLPTPKLHSIPKKILPMKSQDKPVLKKAVETKSKAEPVIHEKTIALGHKEKQVQKDLIQEQLLSDLKKQTNLKKKKHKALEKAVENELKAQAAKTLEQELLSEQQTLSQVAAEKMQGIVDKYKALILQAIAEHWLVPNGVDKNLSSELLIRLAKGGTVLSVQVVKSSGDETLDRSARSAVFKASPLPVPTNTSEFEPFQQFILKVKPENILARDNGLS